MHFILFVSRGPVSPPISQPKAATSQQPKMEKGVARVSSVSTGVLVRGIQRLPYPAEGQQHTVVPVQRTRGTKVSSTLSNSSCSNECCCGFRSDCQPDGWLPSNSAFNFCFCEIDVNCYYQYPYFGCAQQQRARSMAASKKSLEHPDRRCHVPPDAQVVPQYGEAISVSWCSSSRCYMSHYSY